MATDLTWTAIETPLGPLAVVASKAGIVATEILDGDEAIERLAASATRGDRALAGAREDADAYFGGRRRRLRTPVDLSFASGFTLDVYRATMRVPYGEMRTYGDIAADAGSPRAYRAAGTALRHCPIELWIPCHRVVPAGPGFGTYGGHPERRAFLLRLERAI